MIFRISSTQDEQTVSSIDEHHEIQTGPKVSGRGGPCFPKAKLICVSKPPGLERETQIALHWLYEQSWILILAQDKTLSKASCLSKREPAKQTKTFTKYEFKTAFWPEL